MMNIQVHKETWGQAHKHYTEYRNALRTRSDKYLRSLKTAYWHMKRGRGVIDVSKAIAGAGLNEEGEPKLAIAPADWKTVTFKKTEEGGGQFRSSQWGRIYFWMRQGSFPDWRTRGNSYGGIVRENISAPVPVIPALYLPNGKLSRYAILFEVAKWNRAIDKDPILLKRIEGNLFVVLATWDLTPVEEALISSRLE